MALLFGWLYLAHSEKWDFGLPKMSVKIPNGEIKMKERRLRRIHAPRGKPFMTFSIKVTNEMYDKLLHHRQDEWISMNETVRRALDLYFKRAK